MMPSFGFGNELNGLAFPLALLVPLLSFARAPVPLVMWVKGEYTGCALEQALVEPITYTWQNPACTNYWTQQVGKWTLPIIHFQSKITVPTSSSPLVTFLTPKLDVPFVEENDKISRKTKKKHWSSLAILQSFFLLFCCCFLGGLFLRFSLGSFSCCSGLTSLSLSLFALRLFAPDFLSYLIAFLFAFYFLVRDFFAHFVVCFFY